MDLHNFVVFCTECGKQIDPKETYEQYAGRTVCKECRLASRKLRSLSGVQDRGVSYFLKKVRGIRNAAIGLRSSLEAHGLVGSEADIDLFITELAESGAYLTELSHELENSGE